MTDFTNPEHYPAVAIKSDHPEHGGYIVMAKADFDPSKHERYEGRTVLSPGTAVLPPPPAIAPPPPAADPLAALAKDWQTGDAAELKRIAAAVSGRAVENKAQAVQVINAALAARR